MDHFSLLQKYLDLQKNVILDDVIDMGFARIGYSKIESSPYENFSLTNKILSEDELNQIKQEFQKLGRKPAVYFENKQELKELAEILIKNDYRKDREDSWMFHHGENINIENFDSVKKVQNEDDLAIFLKTFDNSFQKDDPQNPFGTLGDYLKIAESGWYKHHATNRLEYFIAYKRGLPAATSALNNYGGIGYISNVGSLKEVRGQGFGKLVTLYCVNASLKNGNSMHYLITKQGTYPNEFYKRLGFKTKFTAVCYFSK